MRLLAYHPCMYACCACFRISRQHFPFVSSDTVHLQAIHSRPSFSSRHARCERSGVLRRNWGSAGVQPLIANRRGGGRLANLKISLQYRSFRTHLVFAAVTRKSIFCQRPATAIAIIMLNPDAVRASMPCSQTVQKCVTHERWYHLAWSIANKMCWRKCGETTGKGELRFAVGSIGQHGPHRPAPGNCRKKTTNDLYEQPAVTPKALQQTRRAVFWPERRQ